MSGKTCTEQGRLPRWGAKWEGCTAPNHRQEYTYRDQLHKRRWSLTNRACGIGNFFPLLSLFVNPHPAPAPLFQHALPRAGWLGKCDLTLLWVQGTSENKCLRSVGEKFRGNAESAVGRRNEQARNAERCGKSCRIDKQVCGWVNWDEARQRCRRGDGG